MDLACLFRLSGNVFPLPAPTIQRSVQWDADFDPVCVPAKNRVFLAARHAQVPTISGFCAKRAFAFSLHGKLPLALAGYWFFGFHDWIGVQV